MLESVKTARNPRGLTTTYSYDVWRRLTSVDYPSANTADVSFTYNNLDQAVTMTDGLGTTTYGYDALHRANSVDGPFANDTVSYGFDAQQRPQSVSVMNSDGSAFATSVSYDTWDRVSTLTSPAGMWTYNYAGNTGRVLSVTNANGTKAEYSYDALLRLTGVANKTSANAILSQYGYTIDNAKSIRTGMTENQAGDPQRDVAYGYDATDQLKTENSTSSTQTRNQSLNYDAMGNRLNRSLFLSPGSDQNASYIHNKLNQLTAMSLTSGGQTTITNFGYDASGNMTTQQRSTSNTPFTEYSYDDADRLIQVIQRDPNTGANTTKSEYVYDGASRKVISREYSWNGTAWTKNEEVRRVYNGMDVVQERDDTNTTQVNYTRSGNIGGILARTDSTGHYCFAYDGSGNVVGLTNAAQSSAAEYSYDGWGNVLKATGLLAATNKYRYSTKEWHPNNGLYDYGYRFYSPSLGRWINRDPIEEEGGLNLYGFVENDPMNGVDEYGLSLGKIVGGVLGQVFKNWRKTRGAVGGRGGRKKGGLPRSKRHPASSKHCKALQAVLDRLERRLGKKRQDLAEDRSGGAMPPYDKGSPYPGRDVPQLPGGAARDTIRGHIREINDIAGHISITRRRIQQECQPGC